SALLADGGADGVFALPVDIAKARQRIVPILRQRKHLRQQPLGLQAEPLVPQVVVAHNGVITCSFYSKYGHVHSSPLRQPKANRGALAVFFVSAAMRGLLFGD